MLLPPFSTGSHPPGTVLHELHQCGSFPRKQSFRNTLFQHGSPTRSQVLPENLYLHGPQLLPEACSCMGSSQAAASFRAYLPNSAWCPPWTAVWISIYSTVDLHGPQGTTCITMVFTMSCRGIFAATPGTPPHLFIH